MTILGAIRKWLQWKSINGDVVIWGSDDVVHFSHELSVLDFEELAKFIEDNIEFKEKP